MRFRCDYCGAWMWGGEPLFFEGRPFQGGAPRRYDGRVCSQRCGHALIVAWHASLSAASGGVQHSSWSGWIGPIDDWFENPKTMSKLPAVRETQKPRMYRDHPDAKVGGVCSAIGHRFGFDPVWLRVVWAVAILWAGVGVLPYLVLWWAIPERDPNAKALPAAPDDPDQVPPELVEAWKEVNDLTEN